MLVNRFARYDFEARQRYLSIHSLFFVNISFVATILWTNRTVATRGLRIYLVQYVFFTKHAVRGLELELSWPERKRVTFLSSSQQDTYLPLNLYLPIKYGVFLHVRHRKFYKKPPNVFLNNPCSVKSLFFLSICRALA